MSFITIYVINQLDEDVSVNIVGNLNPEAGSGEVPIGNFTVSAGGSDFRTLVPSASGYMPWIYPELTCSTAPTKGKVYVWCIREDRSDILVDGLEIRDTNTHTPATDPILITRW